MCAAVRENSGRCTMRSSATQNQWADLAGSESGVRFAGQEVGRIARMPYRSCIESGATRPMIVADQQRAIQRRRPSHADVLHRQQPDRRSQSPLPEFRAALDKAHRQRRADPPARRGPAVHPLLRPPTPGRDGSQRRRSPRRSRRRRKFGARSRRARTSAAAITRVGRGRIATPSRRCSGCTRRPSAKGCRRGPCSSSAREAPRPPARLHLLLAERRVVRRERSTSIFATICPSTRPPRRARPSTRSRRRRSSSASSTSGPRSSREARARGVALGADQRDARARTRRGARGSRGALLRDAYARARRASARSSADDADRLVALGVPRRTRRRHRRHALRPGVGARAARRPRRRRCSRRSRRDAPDARRRLDLAGRRSVLLPALARMRDSSAATRG